MKYLIFFLIGAAVTGCNKQVASGPDSSTTNQASKEYVEKAYEAMGITQVAFKENDFKDYVLATYSAEAEVPNSQPLRYAVIKISDNSVIKQGVLPQGSVRWVDSYILEIIAPPGIPEGNKTIGDYTTQFDVKSGKTISKVTIKK